MVHWLRIQSPVFSYFNNLIESNKVDCRQTFPELPVTDSDLGGGSSNSPTDTPLSMRT